MRRRVYEISFRRYTYTSPNQPGTDWELTTEETKNVMADTSIAAVDELRSTERNRIEIQSIQLICTVDLIAEPK